MFFTIQSIALAIIALAIGVIALFKGQNEIAGPAFIMAQIGVSTATILQECKK
jgi:hypothetical protein